MNLLQYYDEISGIYPEYVTQKQMLEICRVSKSTVYEAERSGLIPFQKEVKRLLHTHKIKLLDVLAYKYKREYGYRNNDDYKSYLRRFYDKRLRSYPNLLMVSDVVKITGFTASSIQRWLSQKYIIAFRKKHCYYIPKEALIDFLVSPIYYSIQDKSEKQKATLHDFTKWYSERIGGVKI